MFSNTHRAVSFALANVLLALTMGCSELPEYYGPLCDHAETGSWSPSADHPELDHIDYYAWVDDPELEASLRNYGMDGSWDFLSGNDVNEDGLVVSPYGRTLNAYEIIVATPGLEGWANTLAQAYPVHGSCGEKAPGIVAVTWKGRSGNRIDVYEKFYDVNAVARAAFLIHEAAHALGAPEHIDDMDRSWDDYGPYRIQAEFLAALYHSPGVPEEFRDMALYEFSWIVRDKFMEPIDITIEDFRPEG
jgi:hypothetical protein